MLFLDIRQAECALDDGRLDEAFDLVRLKDLRLHRRGQDLVGRLVRALVDRGQAHLAGDRYGEACSDCNRAEFLGGNLPEVAELRRAVTQAAVTCQEQKHQRSEVVARAKKTIDEGFLSVGEGMLRGLEADGEVKGLLDHVRAVRMDADAGLDRVRAAMEREDWPVAIEELGRVKRTGVKNDRVAELSGRVVFQVVRRIRAAVDEGRLDLAQAMISPLTTVAGDQPEVRELTRAIQRLSEAAGCIQQGMMHPAIRILRQLASTLPGASWLETAIRNCRQAAEELETLQGGPLGLIGVQGLVMPESNERSEPPAAAGLALPGRFIIRVDGVGSFLVVRNPRATIGPVSSSARPEVGLVADPGLPTVTIDRMEDDYFLRSDGAGSGKLLADGETIELGPRCRMKFRVPNPASTTAIVALTHARLGQGDLRQIILMDREMVMGPGPAAHIRADELTEPVVLFLRDDRLWCAKKMPVTVDGKETQDPAELAPEKQIQIGPVSLTISAA